ncbi:MAG: hypothetical protein R3F61_07050 [Myxococcota bacterium]
MKVGLLLWLVGTAWSAECERPTTAVDLELTVGEAREAYANRDPVALSAAVVEGRVVARCIAEPLSAELADALHLVHGLWIAVEQGEEAAVPYLVTGRVPRQSRAVGLDLTEAEAELVDRLSSDLDTWSLERGAPVAPALTGRLLVDGGPPPARQPANAPFVLQRLRGDSVLATEYVRLGESPRRYRRLRPVLATVGVALVAGTAALTTGAVLTRVELYADHPTPLTDDAVATLAARNHGLLIAAATTGGLAATTAGVFALSYRF